MSDQLHPGPRVAIVHRDLPVTPVDQHGLADLGGPQRGRLWCVRRVIAMNGTPWAAGQAGSLAAILVGRIPSNGNAADPTMVKMPGGAIPFLVSLDEMALCLIHPEHLYVWVNGGSGSELAGGEVEELPWSASRFLRVPTELQALPAPPAHQEVGSSPAPKKPPAPSLL